MEEKMENINTNINDSSQTNKYQLPLAEKRIGDTKCGEKDYNEAITHYKNAIVALKRLFDEENSELATNEEKATELIESVGIPAHLNLALCFLQIEDWRSVVFYSDKVLELSPNNTKAIYRRCKAYIKLGDLENSLKDIEKLEELLEDSPEVRLLKDMHREATKANEAVLRDIGKSFLRKSANSNTSMAISHTYPEKQGIISTILSSGLVKLVIEYSVKKPIRITLAVASGIKFLVIDLPCDLLTRSVQFCVINPSKWMISALGFTSLETKSE